jgi:hypothetical protein
VERPRAKREETDVRGTATKSNHGAKPVLGIVLVLCALYIGWNIGVASGRAAAKPSMFILTEGIGALYQGALFALAGALIAATLTWILPIRIGWVLAAAALLWCALIGDAQRRASEAAEARRRVERGLDVPLPPPENFQLDGRVIGVDRGLDMKVDGLTWEGRWTFVLDPKVTCTARLTAAEAVDLGRVLRMLEEDSTACADEAEPPYVIVRWTRDGRERIFQASSDCRDPIRKEVVRAVFDIQSTAEADRRQTCRGF